ncbi:hypothetical protein F511_44161 [Dorcoceras hygrometricum]|uniref:Uncharacterized protein n=1 Tax=Dorcoceras hygrometricum TaxID=472368 RepID=A0A2Z7AFI4_9LAMI|nr:hypothetical protein F511_44161 [Dorcoceras hygrometricum]
MTPQSTVEQKLSAVVKRSARDKATSLEEHSVASYSATSRAYSKLAIAKRCRLNKLIRQRFAFALRFSWWFAMIKPAGSYSAPSRKHFKINVWTTSRSTMKRKPDAKLLQREKKLYQSTGLQRSENQTQDNQSQYLKFQSVAKQLTNYYEDLRKLDVNC